jgi:hypothetical protein
MKSTRTEENVSPCPHMVRLLEKASKNELRGLARWYAWAHASRCSGCTAFLRRLEAMMSALQGARTSAVNEDQLERLRRKAAEIARAEES